MAARKSDLNKMTNEEFRIKLHERYGDKFDDSQFIFVDKKTKGKLICNHCKKELNVSPVTLFGIKDYHNCKTNTSKISLEEFKERASKVHNNFFNYDKLTEFNGVDSIITITCPHHGDIQVKASNHLNGANCKQCQLEGITHTITKEEKKNKSTKKLTQEEVIKRINEIFGEGRYDINKLVYKNYKTPFTLICHKKDEFGEEHGEFQIDAKHLFRGQGCAKCGKNYVPTNEEFIERIKRKRPELNVSFEKTIYKSVHTPVILTCHNTYKNGTEHGDFTISPANLLSAKQSCPKCNQSKMENEIINLLIDNNINFEDKIHPKWLNGLELDIYLTDYNIGIECQGEQHFYPIDVFGGEDSFKSQIERDKLKLKLCKENNVQLIYYTNVILESYPYFCYTNKEELLQFILSQKKPNLLNE